MTSLSQFSAITITGEDKPLSDYDGQVVLVVNTASECGFTPQYAGLEELQGKFAGRGFTVLGFPCNQFGGQEPGDAQQIGAFCEKTYGVTFPMFDKVEVNGSRAHPLFAWLRTQKSGLLGDRIKWNFTKFLLGRDGQVIERYAPTTKPEALEADIERALG